MPWRAETWIAVRLRARARALASTTGEAHGDDGGIVVGQGLGAEIGGGGAGFGGEVEDALRR